MVLKLTNLKPNIIDSIGFIATKVRNLEHIGFASGSGQNDTLRKLLVGVSIEPIGFFHQ